LVAALVVGGREIIRLTEEFRLEREARQAAEVALEKSRADEKRAAEQRQREADARSEEFARELAASEKRRLDQIRADEDRQRRAMVEAARREQAAKSQAEFQDYVRRRDCSSACQQTLSNCERECNYRFTGSDRRDARVACEDSCKQSNTLCMSTCR
jgi:hypothetical protein